MKKDELESAVLDLWVTTQISLTPANIQYHSGLPRRKLKKWLDELVMDGTLELGSDDAGELVFTVPGADRPASGVRNFAERDRLAALKNSVRAESAKKAAKRRERELAELRAREQAAQEASRSSALEHLDNKRDAKKTALDIALSARRELEKPPGEQEKSLLVSGALSLALGPLGWLYAGSFREAIPAAVAFVVLWQVLPIFILFPILGIAMPLSGVAGLVYAWQHNKTGKRGRLLTKGDDDESQ
ncbi:MAG: hypothetical protein MJE77_35285 [Proteobacteria bacterium]|nr:hypothetical protein [Pseudomonadota bacterium]